MTGQPYRKLSRSARFWHIHFPGCIGYYLRFVSPRLPQSLQKIVVNYLTGRPPTLFELDWPDANAGHPDWREEWRA